MISFQFKLFTILTVFLPQVYSLPTYGGFAPLYPGFGGGVYDRKPLVLTCAINFTDYYKKDAGIVNAIAVTIKEKSSTFGGITSPLLSYVGYASPTGSGLTAVIDIFSAIGGPVSVAFTEKARPEKGCFPNDFGPFLIPKSDVAGTGGYGIASGGYGVPISGYGIGNDGGYGFGNYGGYGGFGGYGIGNFGSYGVGNYGGYGMGGGLGGTGGLYEGGYGGGGYGGGGYGTAGFSPGEDDLSENSPGVVAKVNLSPGTSVSINIDNLPGFSHLKQLAGRGVIVCPRKAVETGHQGSQCVGGILSCCALHYDQEDQRLAGNYNGH